MLYANQTLADLSTESASRAVRRTGLSKASLAWMLLLPSLLVLALFCYGPLLQVLWRSLQVKQFGRPGEFGLGNYYAVLGDDRFIRALSNTAVYAVGTIVPSLVLALLFALVLRETGWLSSAVRTLLVLPMMVPLVAAAALFTFIFLPGAGLIDHYLWPLGLGGANWLGDPALALPSIVAITIWKNTGYYMLFFLAGLAAVPEEQLDAARLEGADAAQRLRYVILPLLGPTIGFVTVISLINVLAQVDHVLVMTGGGPADATNLLLSYIYQTAQQNLDIGRASAATVVSVSGLFALAMVSLRTLEQGVHYES
jgi:sn-glycerol 3-phosphate transport system permease protein